MASGRVYEAGGEIVKSLIHSFRYPARSGQMWEKCAERVRAMGGRVLCWECRSRHAGLTRIEPVVDREYIASEERAGVYFRRPR